MIETHYECPCLEKCPLNYAMSIIGGKWKMQIICSLNNRGTMRYNELRRKMDKISNTVLAASLKELEEEGLVTRKVYKEVPVKVEYSTTELCDRLMPILESLSDWGEELMLSRGIAGMGKAAVDTDGVLAGETAGNAASSADSAATQEKK